jgi:hypothetical protein
MAQANVNDRASVERLYPRAEFERDAAANSDAKATVLRGLRIVTRPDGNGNFTAERTSRHVGERDPEGDTVFLAPYFGRAYAPLQQSEAYGGAEESADAAATAANKADDYDAFIDRMIAAARSADFKPPIGRAEERLRGFRGG